MRTGVRTVEKVMSIFFHQKFTGIIGIIIIIQKKDQIDLQLKMTKRAESA
jgi:hypothetical protein